MNSEKPKLPPVDPMDGAMMDDIAENWGTNSKALLSCRMNGEPAVALCHIRYNDDETVSVYPVFVKVREDMKIEFEEVEEQPTIIIPPGSMN